MLKSPYFNTPLSDQEPKEAYLSKTRRLIFKIVLLIFAIVLIVLFWPEIILSKNSLNNNLGVVQALSTIVLVFITAYYAIQTKQTRNDNVRPILISERFDINLSEDNDNACIKCTLRNLGNGSAFNIYFRFYNKKTKTIITNSIHGLDFIEKGSSSEAHIHIPMKVWDSIKYESNSNSAENNDKSMLIADFIVEMSSHDIFGEHHGTAQLFVLEKEQNRMLPVIGSLRLMKINRPNFNIFDTDTLSDLR